MEDAASSASGFGTGGTHGIPANVELFLRNIRLLNLDLLPDWPSLTQQTFRPGKDALLGQKERVRCAEWALFRLLELLNPKETRTKLRPFFPALEARQSTQLRQALFQSLTDLKTSGIIPRDCALRKSMLDDCRGERLEELLFLLSSAVLRQVVATKQGAKYLPKSCHPAFSTSARDATPEEWVQPLLIAYRDSMRRRSQKKHDNQQKYENFAGRLNKKQLEFDELESGSSREKEAPDEILSASNVDKVLMKAQLRDQCTGDENWLGMIISGDPHDDRDALVEHSFDDMWEQTHNGTLLTYAEVPSGRLNELDQTVQRQQDRLRQLHSFQREVSKRNEDLIVMRSPLKTPIKSSQKVARSAPRKSPTKSAKPSATSTSPLKKTPSGLGSSSTATYTDATQARQAKISHDRTAQTSRSLFAVTGDMQNGGVNPSAIQEVIPTDKDVFSDYESVFRARPKVRTSPPGGSPIGRY